MPRLNAIRTCWVCGKEFDRSGCDCDYLIIRHISGMKEKRVYICPDCSPGLKFKIQEFVQLKGI